MVAIAAGIMITTSQYGAFVQQEYVKGGFGYYHFNVTAADAARHKSLYELIKLVPPRAKIVASENIVPHVSNRPDAYTLRMDFTTPSTCCSKRRGVAKRGPS